MKKKYFYTHLVETTHITLEIAELDLKSQERVHLLSLVEANIHSTVVSNVLSNLKPEDKKIFLENLSLENHEKTWGHLKEKVSDIEDKIKSDINLVVRELRQDVKTARKIKS